MRTAFFTALLAFNFLIVNFVAAQSIDSTLVRYAADYTQEKMHVHYDKAAYAPGETIWFKAYIMEGLFPGEKSRTLYLDWIGEDGRVLSHSVSPVVEAFTNGQLEIPASYKGRVLHVRGYTRYMLNFDTTFLYAHDLNIIQTAAAAANPAPKPVFTLNFFPEGGDLVSGVPNKLAFLANDQYGRPQKVWGVIKDEQGTLVDSFKTVHNGMGYLNLIPFATHTYTATWKDQAGGIHSTPVQAVKSTGMAMQIMISGDKRVVEMHLSDNAGPELQHMYLIGTIGGQPAFKTDIMMKPGDGGRKVIPESALPTGLLTITAFDNNWKPVAERVCFINHHDFSFPTSMEVTRWGTSKRAKNDIKITVPANIQPASLSIAVTDASLEKDSAYNIFTQLLLNSDLKGYIYHPQDYFKDSSLETAHNLDLVMLTHGWRRFAWDRVVAGKFPDIQYPRDTAYLTMSGKVFGVAKSQLSGKESIVLIIKQKDSSSRMAIMNIDRNGNFGDDRMLFFDTVRVYYQLKSKLFTNAEARFMLDRLPTPNYMQWAAGQRLKDLRLYDTTGLAWHNYLAARQNRLTEMELGKVMQTVTVTTKAKPTVDQMDEKYASGMFKSGDSYQFDLVNDVTALGAMDIFSYLQGRVAGLNISTGGGTPSLSWRGSTPSLFLDEMNVDADMISTIPVSDIAYVKVFRPPFAGAPLGGAGGAIAIYTRKGNDATNAPGRGGLSTNAVAGYSEIREFYSPNYASFKAENEKEDLRTTLYWNPMLSTNAKNHELNLSFYNNDVSKSFRVIIEGMTKDGMFTHMEEIIE